MERLSQEQQESLRKTSNERLRVMAARIGSVSDEEIAVMDRAALLQIVAAGSTARAEGDKDVTPSATARKPPGEVEMQLELKRAELELKRMEAEDKKAERESRKAELEVENKKAEREAEERKAERDLRMRQMEVEERKDRMEMEEKDKQRQDRKDQMEFDLRLKELEMQGERQRLEHEAQLAQSERGSVAGVGGMRAECHDDEDDSGEPIEPRVITRPRDRATVLADRVKRYGSALKQVISPMSEDPVEIPAFFETYENVCHAFEVPDDLKPKLLLPFLCKKARSFTARLSVVQLDDYEYVKDFILNQFKLTPRQYKARFDQAEKRFDETFKLIQYEILDIFIVIELYD